ncbi:MAG: Asp-tRNA(Asn)/Glu-tRNA(Gln) amidotransferase subunit GatA [Deltaproteobacteria bacterium]|nr:Asp-tRNA(Asn)/Glu-tRNA(Gln) amidotransferase subunit GatA [Deltaproteobacteria bacterium]
MDIYQLTLHEAHELLESRQIRAEELTRQVFARIAAVDPDVCAYLTLAQDLAMDAAREADHAIDQGKAGPLTGIPVAVKDLLCTQDLRTTCGSRILENFVPVYDSTIVERLKAGGAVIVGKTNLDEFGMGSSNEHSAFMPTRNPWDLSRVPGGSSGGSAAAVAADECIAAIGTDTGGSIRQPCSHCGVVGLKPTYGRVSRFGLVAFASSLDQIGPITKDVTDCALLMNAISGYDARDSTSVPRPVPDYTRALRPGLDGLVAGIPKEYHDVSGVDKDVAQAVRTAIEALEGLGLTCRQVSLPHTEYAVATYYIIAPAEASSNLARYDGVKYGFRDAASQDLMDMYRNTRSRGFGREVQRRIIIGTYALSAGYYDAYYGKASQVRTLIMDDFRRAFESCDVLLAPVAPTPAFKLGSKLDDPLSMYLSDIFTLPASLAGIPGMSVPCGFSRDGLPIGLQILAEHFAEEKILQVAYNLEQAQGIRQRKPTLQPGSNGGPGR